MMSEHFGCENKLFAIFYSYIGRNRWKILQFYGNKLNWYGARGDCANKGDRLAESDNAETDNRLEMIAFCKYSYTYILQLVFNKKHSIK